MMTSLMSLVKEMEISPAPPPQWKVRPSYGDYRGGVISMRGDLYIQDTIARECV